MREAKTGEFNSLSPKSDQYPVADLDFQIRGRENKNNGGGGGGHSGPLPWIRHLYQFSPNNTNRLSRKKLMITKRKIFDRLSLSFNEFFKQMFEISLRMKISKNQLLYQESSLYHALNNFASFAGVNL